MKKVTFKKRLLNLSLISLLFFAGLGISNAQEAYLGEIRMFAGNFAPRGWALCEGQLLSISSNSALFSILGTMYGGDGRTTFALPDLRGRNAIGAGHGPGLSDRRQGPGAGAEFNVLTVNNMPNHSHSVAVSTKVSSDVGTTPDPTGAYLAKAETALARDDKKATNVYSTVNNTSLAPNAVGVTLGNTGGNQQVNNMAPYTVIRYIICIQGIFPSRS